jgi:hypothetical protein
MAINVGYFKRLETDRGLVDGGEFNPEIAHLFYDLVAECLLGVPLLALLQNLFLSYGLLE